MFLWQGGLGALRASEPAAEIPVQPGPRSKWRRGWDSNLRHFAGVRARSRNPGATGTAVKMAERVGFELEAHCGRLRPQPKSRCNRDHGSKWRRGWDSNLRHFAGVRARSRNPGATGTAVKMAERVGFEPTVRFPARSLSRRVLSTAQSPLRRGLFTFYQSGRGGSYGAFSRIVPLCK